MIAFLIISLILLTIYTGIKDWYRNKPYRYSAILNPKKHKDHKIPAIWRSEIINEEYPH